MPDPATRGVSMRPACLTVPSVPLECWFPCSNTPMAVAHPFGSSGSKSRKQRCIQPWQDSCSMRSKRPAGGFRRLLPAIVRTFSITASCSSTANEAQLYCRGPRRSGGRPQPDPPHLRGDQLNRPIVPKPIRCVRNQLTREDELGRLVGLARIQAGANGGVFIIADADDDCAAELGQTLLTHARKAAGHTQLAVTLACREFRIVVLGRCRKLELARRASASFRRFERELLRLVGSLA